MADLKDIISNIEQIYGSNNSLNLLKDFERVIDELDIYVFDNWEDGELLLDRTLVSLPSQQLIPIFFPWILQ